MHTAKHFFVWIILIPWCASTAWLWLHGVFNGNVNGVGAVIVSLLIDGIGAWAGVLFCSVITVPIASIVYFTLTVAPKSVVHPMFRVMFVIGMAAVGGLWGAFSASKLGSTGSANLLIIIGIISGVALALSTLRIWTVKIE